MTTTLDLSAADLALSFQRGDTFQWTVTLQDSDGDALTLPLTNTYLLSVDTNPDPTDTSTQIFQLTGVILTQSGATLGQVQFGMSLADWTAFDAVVTAPDTVSYDLQEKLTSGEIRTLAKGDFAVDQDITKAT